MNHNKSYRKLGRRADHRKAMLMNLTISLILSDRIETTVTRAKELRKFAEKIGRASCRERVCSPV